MFLKVTIMLSMLSLLTSCQLSRLDRGSFKNMDRSLNNTRYGYQIINDPTGKAPTELIERFEVRDGDCTHEGAWSDCSGDRERSELKEPINRRITRSGSEYWYGWSIYIPENFPNIYPTKTALGQFHQNYNQYAIGDPLFMLVHKKDGLFFDDKINGIFNYDKLIDEKELRGKWHKFEIYVNWNSDWKKGKMKIWINDELKLNYSNSTCKHIAVYFKYGIYRSFMSRYKSKYKTDKVPTQIVYYANVKRAKTREGLKVSIKQDTL